MLSMISTRGSGFSSQWCVGIAYPPLPLLLLLLLLAC